MNDERSLQASKIALNRSVPVIHKRALPQSASLIQRVQQHEQGFNNSYSDKYRENYRGVPVLINTRGLPNPYSSGRKLQQYYGGLNQ